MSDRPLSPARLIELLAETDDALAQARSWSPDRPYKQSWIDAYVERRLTLARRLRQREKQTAAAAVA
jgi:hypothetical protein